MGLVLGVAARQCGSVLPGMVFHVGHNLLIALVMSGRRAFESETGSHDPRALVVIAALVLLPTFFALTKALPAEPAILVGGLTREVEPG